VKIEEIGGKLNLHDRKKPASTISEWHCVVPFPENVVSNLEDRHALLAYSG
jgi:hypothetical protein